MKNTATCPKCGGHKLFWVRDVRQPPEDDGWENQPFPFAITSVWRPSGGHGRYDILSASPCESVICAACGYVEWYASPQALKILEQIVQRGEGDVKVVQGPATAPYR